MLHTAGNAIANLADLAGEVSVSVRAESEAGLDLTKFQNGVMEPLRATDPIKAFLPRTHCTMKILGQC